MIQLFEVSGLTCSHCQGAVESEVGALEGVSDVSVELVPDGISLVRVQADHDLTRDELEAALAEAGDYSLA